MLPIASDAGLLIHTDRERLTFRRPTKPEWASAIGRDRSGHGAKSRSIQVTADRSFNGCAGYRRDGFGWARREEEQGRFDGEGPRHPSHADRRLLAVRYAMHPGIMGSGDEENPSRFQSLTRPVEQVRWNDVLTFMNLINAWIPGLDLAAQRGAMGIRLPGGYRYGHLHRRPGNSGREKARRSIPSLVWRQQRGRFRAG